MDIKSELATPFLKGAKENGVDHMVNFIGCDINCLKEHIPHSSQDLVIFNPPHYEGNRGKNYSNDQRKIARAYDENLYENYAAAVKYLLKNRGHFYTVIAPVNFTEWLMEFKKYNLIVKNVKAVYGKSENARLLLIHGIKNANTGFLRFEKPLFLNHQSR